MTDAPIYLSIDEWNQLLGINDSYKAPDALWRILKDKQRRENLFRETLELHRYQVDVDWFHQYFQEEHAQRKKYGQDFTPNSVSTLLARIVNPDGEDGNYYEPSAGSGGIVIRKWDEDRCQHTPFSYRPSMYLYRLDELSDRAVPFLLFNTMLRGMNAVIVHGDVLTKETKAVYFVQNDADDHLQFSNLYRMPVNQATADHLDIVWADGAIYEEIDTPGEWPAHVTGAMQALQKRSGE
ncbi:N-6 DNA methylase [Sporosarcina trichiuri]|uniref:N-6 DNA methylase n=1 Tax=Sporosarcina trichiuri TaxID=3056445 RepID=UPI0025B2ED93|nr:N-6 DNA methylase [Sporosarcina sp. 0.2-SM1T-5]WJY27434.1 N-6 DNA methylase [Sporosarcina sp. 0.2-SM1T-5]WJY27454.1 N-6 DNA methylase [Sporosarcina sp. 0.2-SM1T-5]